MTEQKPPVTVGEEVDVRVEAVGEKGDGIVRRKGFVLFVSGATKGEEIRIKITKVLEKVGFATKIGPAQGPIEDSKPKSKKPRRERVSDADVAAVMSHRDSDKPGPEDSDDFGSDLEDEDF